MIKQEKRITKTKELLKKRINAKIFEFKLFNEFLKLIRLLSKDFPDFNIVIKPHPTEDPKDWLKSIKKYRNVYVDSQFELQASMVYANNNAEETAYSNSWRQKELLYRYSCLADGADLGRARHRLSQATPPHASRRARSHLYDVDRRWPPTAPGSHTSR